MKIKGHSTHLRLTCTGNLVSNLLHANNLHTLTLIVQGPRRGVLLSQYPDFEKLLSTLQEPSLMNQYPNIPISTHEPGNCIRIPATCYTGI